MQIVISSHINYYHLTIPPLLASLSASGVPTKNVTVVVGGVTGSVGSPYVNVPYNHFEYNGLRYIAELKNKPDYICLLHDTVTVQSHFWDTVKNVKEMTRMVPIKAWNMGVYPSTYLTGELPILKSIMTKIYAAMRVDYIFDWRPFGKYFGKEIIDGGVVDFYGTGQLRDAKIYPDMGIVKYQANNGRNGMILHV